LVAPIGYGAHDVERVFVMHRVAAWANGAIFGVTVVWQAVFDSCTAVFAVFDGCSENHLRSLKANLNCDARAMKKGPKFSLRALKLFETTNAVYFVVLVCFSINAFAPSSNFLPSKPFLFMSSTHSNSMARDLLRKFWASAAFMV
jgi:hypothetical protein